MGDPLPIGHLLADAVKDVKVGAAPHEPPQRPEIMPNIERSRDKIRPAIRKAIQKAIEARKWPLVFIGGPGTGKSCAALCVLDYGHSEPFSYWTETELAAQFAAAKCGTLFYPGGGLRSAASLMYDISMYRCVCVDELGTKGNMTDTTYEAVKLTIDARQGKPAVFVSNLGMESLGALYDERILSRLSRGTVINFGNGDRRV